MKNVIILGADGNIARQVIEMLQKKEDINPTLFLRNAQRIKNREFDKSHVIDGDVLDYNKLKRAITGQDIVYANLSGDIENMAINIVKVMEETGVAKLIFICSMGIYDLP